MSRDVLEYLEVSLAWRCTSPNHSQWVNIPAGAAGNTVLEHAATLSAQVNYYQYHIRFEQDQDLLNFVLCHSQ
jgi:hypothetical protein